MDRALDPERHFSEQKSISPVRENQNLSIDDITTAKIEVLDSLNSVFQLFKSINNDAKLHEFKFLPGWANLEKPRKLELYSKYSCHELNFFIYKKDPTFFNEVVKPYIAHKRDKTFMDKWLLNMDMKEWLNPWSFGRLNIVEKILLSQRIKEKRTSIKRHVKDLCDLLPKDEERFNFLFKIALKGSALDTGDKLAINEALAEPSMPPSPSMARKKMRLQRPASKPSASLRSAPKMELEEMAAPYDADMSFDDGFGASDEKERREITRQLFKQLEKTEEWVENNYYKIPVEQQVSDLITINEFWKDYALHEAGSPFLSAHIAQASNNFTEMALALAVIDLPFDAPDHKTEFKKTKMQLDPGCGIIAFHREIKPVREVSKTQSILTGQNFFALDDRYYYEGNERFDKFVTEEFLVRRVYGCQVVLTNPTSSRKNVDMLIQIPNGAIPVKKSLYTNSINMQLEPFSTRTSEYYFYFPEPGTQIHYPVHVSQEETMIVAGNPFIFNVVNSLTSFDKTAWTYVSENGTNDEVIEYLENNNIERLDLELTAFRLKEEKFFNRIYKLLKSRHTYNDTVWSYSIYHCNQQAISEYLEHNSFAENCGSWVASKLLNPDPIERHIYQHKEYKPLVNARVYQLGKKREILNKQFSKQYTEFLSHLKYKKSLSDYDRMALVYYMLLQDRIAQASEIFNQIKDYTQVNSIQYDYLNAYLAFSHEKPEKAIKIADKYKDFPVLRWQNLFKTVIAQAEEIQGNSPDVVDEKDLSQRQEKYASLQPELDFSIEKDKLLLNYNNISQAKVNIYQMDIELLFSKMPFVQELSGQFSVIKPNHSFKKELPENQNSLTIDIPETLKNSNLMVEVSAEGITRSTAHYPNSLLVSMFEEYGQLQIRHQHSKKPLSKVYIKVYGKMKNGETRFYKDGYTDLRGKFDYASLSTNELDNVERFAILISSESHGSLIKEASVPNR
jgi:predicted transcriptional regulator